MPSFGVNIRVGERNISLAVRVFISRSSTLWGDGSVNQLDAVFQYDILSPPPDLCKGQVRTVLITSTSVCFLVAQHPRFAANLQWRGSWWSPFTNSSSLVVEHCYLIANMTLLPHRQSDQRMIDTHSEVNICGRKTYRRTLGESRQVMGVNCITVQPQLTGMFQQLEYSTWKDSNQPVQTR